MVHADSPPRCDRVVASSATKDRLGTGGHVGINRSSGCDPVCDGCDDGHSCRERRTI